MHPFPASYFLRINTVLWHYRAFSDFSGHPGRFASFRRWLGRAKADDGRWPKHAIINKDDRLDFDCIYKELEEICTSLDLPTSVSTVRRVRGALKKTDSTYGDFWASAQLLEERLRDEIELRTYFALSLKEAGMYQRPRDGWEQVILRFPDAVGDIEECNKCFALARYAAAVFHSLQAVEVGLIELGRIIVVNDPLPGWTATTQRLKTIIKAKYADMTAFQQQHKALLEQLDATAEALKSSWRNKVSHVHGKMVLMTSDFAPEVAEEILVASRGFMRRLATEAPTCPDPDA